MKDDRPLFRPYSAEACQIPTPVRVDALCADEDPSAEFDYGVRDQYRERQDPLGRWLPAVPYELAASFALRGMS